MTLSSKRGTEFRVTLGSVDSRFPVLIWIGDDENNARGAYSHERKRWAADKYMLVRLESRPVGEWEPVDD